MALGTWRIADVADLTQLSPTAAFPLGAGNCFQLFGNLEGASTKTGLNSISMIMTGGAGHWVRCARHSKIASAIVLEKFINHSNPGGIPASAVKPRTFSGECRAGEFTFYDAEGFEKARPFARAGGAHE